MFSFVEKYPPVSRALSARCAEFGCVTMVSRTVSELSDSDSDDDVEISVLGVIMEEGDSAFAGISASDSVPQDIEVSYSIIAGTADGNDVNIGSGVATISANTSYACIDIHTTEMRPMTRGRVDVQL